MNYKKILIKGSLSKKVNHISNMIALQGLAETSADSKGFNVIVRTGQKKNTIVERKAHEDKKVIPHVRKLEKEIEVKNYLPTSMYTVRKLAHLSQSPKFAKK